MPSRPYILVVNKLDKKEISIISKCIKGETHGNATPKRLRSIEFAANADAACTVYTSAIYV